MSVVKPRFDGSGDAWAKAHRDELGNAFLMTDLDAVIGVTAFAQNTGDRLFLEYVPDDYANRTKRIRTFGVVSFFDRKSSLSIARDSRNNLCTAIYLHLARAVSAHQPKPARFFWIIGGSEPPWTMVEVDIETGEEVGPQVTVSSGHWENVWRQLGLIDLRSELYRWALRGAA